MHTPVLLQEVITGLNIKKNGLYIDATVGEGGHMLEIAKRGGRVLGIDWDNKQIQNLELRIKNYKDIKLEVGNFCEIESIAKKIGFYPVDGVLFDLGLSMDQIQKSGRGFSYKKLGEPLDMRIDTSLVMTAAKLLKSLDQNELYEIFANYSEEINSLAISQALIRARSLRPIEKVADLIKIIDQVVGHKKQPTYARIFQALRIAVNDELENLKKGLKGALRVLKRQGRIIVISFHSLEDRIVKQFIRQNQLRQLNKKIIIAKDGLAFERSAKLRIFKI